ncbi:MAG TPA: DUF1080 domain-containing protein [Gemmatimonadaceae bacterium]|jgi:hypothetical protein|nr:DUF1080 domain-containing protein [Gemmatimonadaceae bacterium]
MRHRVVRRAVTILAGLALAACARAEREAMEPDVPRSLDALTAAQRAAGWRPLFDGATTAGWRGYHRDDVPAGWQVVDGALTRVAEAGDIVTVEEYESFELVLEWMVPPGGNSGVFYHVTDEGERTYTTGPEMQVLDDSGHADGGSRLTAAGAAYAIYPALPGAVKPAGQWNSARLVVNGAHVEHWLNGTKVVDYELWSPDWEARVQASKFASAPGYGRAKRGRIGLQDHGDRVAFRNILIRVLP